jgi:SAM-dependent methyltransferase
MSDRSTACRSCGESPLTPLLALGQMPLASRLLSADELCNREPSFPLELVLCPRCALVQSTHNVQPEEQAAGSVYLASFSESMLRGARQLSSQIMATQRLRPTSLVVEIASNDGYLLRNYRAAGIPVLGIEPVASVAEVARRQHKIPTLEKFFTNPVAAELEGCGQPADVIHARNVLAHVADPNDFAAALHTLLKPTGVAVIEVPYVKDLIDHVEFDTIYHEHQCYFSLTSLAALLSRHRLVVQDVERVAQGGGSLRVLVGRSAISSPRVQKLLAEEMSWGVQQPDFYIGLTQRIERLRRELTELLGRLKAEGRSIVGYGASAKGTTLLNYCGIGRDTVEFVVDRNTLKQGRYTPGTHLKVYSPDKLVEERPDYVLLLSWNLAEEILAQQAVYRQRGGRFIIPLPSLKVA